LVHVFLHESAHAFGNFAFDFTLCFHPWPSQ
jgi:hypothetical protein